MCKSCAAVCIVDIVGAVVNLRKHYRKDRSTPALNKHGVRESTGCTPIIAALVWVENAAKRNIAGVLGPYMHSIVIHRPSQFKKKIETFLSFTSFEYRTIVIFRSPDENTLYIYSLFSLDRVYVRNNTLHTFTVLFRYGVFALRCCVASILIFLCLEFKTVAIEYTFIYYRLSFRNVLFCHFK
jgi:hypothetical protein